MKNKKILSIVLSGTLFATGIGLLPTKAMAKTKTETKVEQNSGMEAGKLVFKALNELNEKNIKEARKAVAGLPNSNTKLIYTNALNYTVYKNIDKKVSPVDELMNAYKKTMKVRSGKSTVNFDINVNGKNLSKEEEETMKPLMAILNDFKMDGVVNYILNEKNTKLNADCKIDMNIMNQMLNLKAWMDMDMQGKEPNMKYVVNIPNEMKMLSPELKGKDYIVYDMSKFYKQFNQNIDGNMMESYTKFSKKFEKEMIEFLRTSDAELNLVTRNGEKTTENGKVQMYQIKIDNEKLTKMIKYMFKDETMRNLIKDYVKESINLGAQMQDDKLTQEQMKELQKGINEGIDDVEKQLEITLQEINKVATYEFTIDFGINQDGYISYEAGKVNFNVDASKIEQSATKANYAFEIKFSSETSKINEDVKVEKMPEITKENSIDYFEFLMKSMMQTEVKTETVTK